LAYGLKEVRRNPDLSDEFYESLQQNSSVFRLESWFSFQRVIGRSSAIFNRTSYGLMNSDVLFSNELFRLGGLKSLRGHNERQFFSQEYVINQLEYRLFFETQSYFFLFYDQLIYRGLSFSDQPWGTGLGISLATQSGQFNFVIAGGSSASQRLDFSNAKIHFGYTATF
jgi:hemolysin activation/secretion protein